MKVVTEGVYFLYDGNELVYVGTSDNMYRRIGEHIADGNKQFDTFKLYPTHDRLRLEGFLIDALKPRYNIAHGKNPNNFIGDDGGFFPNSSVMEAIKKYEEYRGDPFVHEIADEIGTYTRALLSGLARAGAPVYNLDGKFRLDKEWYLAHKEKMWDYVP